MFLYGQSPYPTGAPEISELTRSSRTRVAATQGALPGALIKLTCALITPRLSPISSSLESCLLHPLLEMKQTPPPPDTDPATVLFAGQEHAVSLWGGCTKGSRIKPDSGLHRRPTGKGCMANIIPLCLQPSQLSSTHSSAAAVTHGAQALRHKEHDKPWHKHLLYFHEKVISLCTCIN